MARLCWLLFKADRRLAAAASKLADMYEVEQRERMRAAAEKLETGFEEKEETPKQ